MHVNRMHKPSQRNLVRPARLYTETCSCSLSVIPTGHLAFMSPSNQFATENQKCCRELGPKVSTVSADRVRPLELRDLRAALASIRPSVAPQQLQAYADWTSQYGTHA